jgi:hypothetical protein
MTLGSNPKVWSILTIVALTTVFCGVSLGQEEIDPAGKWEMTVPGPNGDMTIFLTLENNDGDWSGTIENPLTGSIPLQGIKISGNSVKFDYMSKRTDSKVTYTGSVDAETGLLSGNFSAAGASQKQPAKFYRSKDSIEGEDGAKKYRVGSGPEGIWHGKVRSPDGEDTQVILTLDNENGDYIATLEDPFVDLVRGENVQVTNTMISFTFRPDGAQFPSHFTGTYVAAEDRVTGSFSQRGVSRFVKFHRDPATVILGFTPDGEIIEPARVRHQHNFGVNARLSYWVAVHMVKDEVYNMNSITAHQLNFDGALRWHALDAFAIYVRGYRGGFGFTDNSYKIEPFTEYGLTSNSSITMDGWEVGITGYFGNILNEDSRFNPYMTAAAGQVVWEVNEGERGSAVISIDDKKLRAVDLAVGFGLGTEYELSRSFNLEFEWMWRIFLTKDETRWANANEIWGDTHAWALSLGLTYMFF